MGEEEGEAIEEAAAIEDGGEKGVTSCTGVVLLEFFVVILILLFPGVALGVEDWIVGYKLDLIPSCEQQLEPEGVCLRLGSSLLSESFGLVIAEKLGSWLCFSSTSDFCPLRQMSLTKEALGLVAT